MNPKLIQGRNLGWGWWADPGAGSGFGGASVGSSGLMVVRGGSGVTNFVLGAESEGSASMNALANSVHVL